MNPASISGIKNAAEACRIVRSELENWIAPGMTTGDIDRKAVELIKQTGAVSAVYGRSGFPGHICICLNNEVAHFYGKDKIVVLENDLVKIDISLRKESWVADCGATLYFGNDAIVNEMLKINRQTVIDTADCLCPGLPAGDITEVIDSQKKQFHYYRELSGHGTGESLHCAPRLSAGSKEPLKAGQIIAVEAVFSLQNAKLKFNGMEITSDSLNVHHEETVLITANGGEVLTDS